MAAETSAGRSKTVFLLGSFAPSLINFRGPLIKELIAKGHRVIAGAPECVGGVADALRALGAEPVSIPLARSGMNPLGDLAFLRRLERIFRETRPDLLIAYTAKPVIWGALAAHRAGVPRIVAMITGLGFAFIEGAGWKRRVAGVAVRVLYRRALAVCDAIIFQNCDDRDDFVSMHIIEQDQRINVVNGSGVELDRFGLGPVRGGPAFLMIARLLHDKGVREFSEAAAAVKEEFPSVTFRLVGASDPSPDMVSAADIALWSRGAVEYMGELEDVRPAIAAVSVYVLPSYREGTPRSTLEAMAMGRAVITTDVPGCRETVVHGENGFLIPPRDAHALAAAMTRLIVEPELAVEMGAASRRIAEERFDVRDVNRRILEIVGLE